MRVEVSPEEVAHALTNRQAIAYQSAAGPSALGKATDLRKRILFTLGLLIVPLNPNLLDFLLACSIALSLVVFLVSFYVRDSMEFSVFPVLLLISTVFRLSLNISSTRLILSEGGNGTVAAGKIIETFGNFVTGGNFAVGLVIFIILIIINFVVVTKGAGRIAEVAARFTLDAMPGKQMAIDADLNAGLIDDAEARKRRKDVALEADFHGAMDGASKFIRGDAIAGILVTPITLTSYDIGTLLDSQGVAVRTGHHCTQPLMERYDIPGTVRASFGAYNTLQEVDTFVAGTVRAVRMLREERQEHHAHRRCGFGRPIQRQSQGHVQRTRPTCGRGGPCHACVRAWL